MDFNQIFFIYALLMARSHLRLAIHHFCSFINELWRMHFVRISTQKMDYFYTCVSPFDVLFWEHLIEKFSMSTHTICF